ncbi:odorant receptor 4-like [Zophobas morio]|uniref:odorant receptor 4-like n=1 Tax=Zophobas morio TaxID=2755281 RepID=UPI0030827634
MFVAKGYDFTQVVFIGLTLFYALKLLPFLNGNDRIKKCISYFDGDEFQPRDETKQEILSKIPALLSNENELPLPMWLPYSINKSSVIYYTTYVYLCIAIVYVGFATALLDPLIGGLAFQAVSQLKILKHRLQNLQNFSKYGSNSTLIQTGIYQQLIGCVEHHNAILKFVSEYEQCFSWTIFNQFMGTTSVLCFICIAITTVPLVSIDAVKYIIFFFVVNWQALFYCYFGTLLYEESDTLVTAIYLSQWYEYPVEAQKIIFTLMERAKQPMILSAEKLLDLTLDTFTAILKRSYSLIAFLK